MDHRTKCQKYANEVRKELTRLLGLLFPEVSLSMRHHFVTGMSISDMRESIDRIKNPDDRTTWGG